MSNKRKITYKCPYCDKRFNKEDLVSHVGDKHDDMIPEGYSAFRLVFDYVNKKPSGYNGKCIICGNESGWDENKGKYNRICSNPACKKKYIQSFEERMMKSKGVTRISSTAEGQAKMLANRKISGEYKFQDGGIRTYTGTYEKKALEFMDKVMNIQSIDVTTPGPIMEYDFEGKKHIYISDIYYAPYNLIIEVKDGGDNPNNRNMPEYRAKQIAKEKWIIKNTDYNYLRLTNNDFSQLLAVFMELKMEMSNDTPERVIRINEGKQEYIEEISRSEIKSDFLEKGDSCYNLDKWPDQYNILFITGISGSGKTTLGIDLSKEFNCNRVELDYIAVYYLRKCKERNAYEKFRNKLQKECPEAVEFFDLNPVEKYGIREKWGDTGDILKDFCDWFITKFSNNGKSYIINGSYLYDLYDANFYYNKPLIIKDINLIKTVFRRVWREFSDSDDKFFRKLESAYKALKTGLSKQYRDANKKFKSYKKDMNNNAELKESYIEEGFLKSEPDILYNKEAFDSGEINLCFLTGFSGSGKSTLAHGKESNEIEAYELDDILWNHRFSDDNLKEYGDLIYSYFKGPGKKYRVYNKEEFKKLFRSGEENAEASNVNGCTQEFIDHVKEFVKYSINYSKSHKNKKYIIEGIYLYMFFEPSYFDNYAFYIKGTSLLKSTKRALKRDWENNKINGDDLSKRINKANRKIIYTIKNIKYDNTLIDKFIKYFKNKPETVLSEFTLLETKNASVLNDGFKKKSGKSFKLIDFKNQEVSKYISDKWQTAYRNTRFGRIAICKEDDKLAGYIYWNKSGTIGPLEVYTDYRGYGLSEILMKEAIKNGGNNLGVYSDNEVAINLYKKLGFVEIGRKKYKDGDVDIMMELKSEIKEDTDVTEAMNALMTGYIPGSVDNPNNVYIVNYMQNNVFSDEDPNEDCIGVSDNPKFTNLVVRDKDGVLKKVDESFLNDKTYKVYIFEMSRDEVSNRLNKYMNTEVDKGFIYETLTGKKLYTNDQVQFESSFIPTLDYYEFMESFKEICDNYFQLKDKKIINTNESTFVPEEIKVFNKSGLMEIKEVHSMDDYVSAKPSKVLEYFDINIKE